MYLKEQHFHIFLLSVFLDKPRWESLKIYFAYFIFLDINFPFIVYMLKPV